jgi:hypothetical protein
MGLLTVTVNCQLSTVNCQLSTVNCQLSTVNRLIILLLEHSLKALIRTDFVKF